MFSYVQREYLSKPVVHMIWHTIHSNHSLEVVVDYGRLLV
jgi:hypothetical protein